MDQLVLFCRESQEGKHKHLDIFELIPQVFLPNHKGPRAEKKNFFAWHTAAQASIAWETLSARLPVDSWTSLRSGPQFCRTPDRDGSDHQEKQGLLSTCREVQSYLALSCLSTAAPSPKDSQSSSVSFFIEAGYKTLVISETTQIQCSNPETTTITITDFQSKAAKTSSTHWVLLGEKWLWESANCSQIRLSDTYTVLEKNKSQESATVGTSVLSCCQDSSN